MSFRRVQSIHDRSLQNGSPVHASPLSTSSPQAFFVPTQAEASPTFSFLSPRQTPLEKSKAKGHFWRKPFFHFFLCFVLGFGIGLTPLSKRDLITAPEVGNKRAAREEFTQGFGSDIEPGPRNSSNGIQLKETDTSNIHTDESSTLVPRKLLLIITPTYTRPFQALYLTRLAHTLKLVPAPLLWLVVESPVQSLETAAVLRKTGVMYRHLVCGKNLTNVKDRGVHQRNIALMHIEKHQLDGIVYFADDDNVYSLELFDQLREIKRFGTWPVGMLAQSKSKAILEGPVCEGNTVIGWHTNEKSKRLRRFHVDMSGFGFNSTILWDPRRWRRPNLDPIRQLDTVKEGFQETTFIEQLVEDESQMEGLPSNCLKIMVWHLHLEAQNLDYPSGWRLEKSLEPTVHI